MVAKGRSGPEEVCTQEAPETDIQYSLHRVNSDVVVVVVAVSSLPSSPSLRLTFLGKARLHSTSSRVVLSRVEDLAAEDLLHPFTTALAQRADVL
jgi:hypothetical protein